MQLVKMRGRGGPGAWVSWQLEVLNLKNKACARVSVTLEKGLGRPANDLQQAMRRRDRHAISLYLNERGITSSTNKHSLSLGLWSWKTNGKKRMTSEIKDHTRNRDRIMWRCKFVSVRLKIKCYSSLSNSLSHLLPPCKISALWRNSTGNRSCCHSYCSSSVIKRNIVLQRQN